MFTVQKYVESLSDQEKLVIIENYERFEKDGAIGDEPIRFHAVQFIKLAVLGTVSIVVLMEKIAFECYRYFAKKHLEMA